MQIAQSGARPELEKTFPGRAKDHMFCGPTILQQEAQILLVCEAEQ